jgi:predicted DNA binding CopG/RHH family protein
MKKKKIQLNPPYFDDEEKDIIEAYKRGEFKPVKDQAAFKAATQRAAENFIRKQKEARVNIRFSQHTVDLVKERAEEEGLPYQTLISSIVHKFVTGRLVEARK